MPNYDDLDLKLTNVPIHEPLLLSAQASNAIEEVDHLSTHSRIDGIADLEVITEGIFVEGTGHLEVELQHGSDSDVEADKGAVGSDAFPMKFKVLLDANGEIQEVLELEIDISRSYE